MRIVFALTLLFVTVVEDQPGYSTHVIARNAVQFIERNADRPFFLLVAHEAGSTTDELAMGMDLLPTFMELEDIAIPKDRELDGISLRGLLLENANLPKRQVFFGYEPKLGTAMRDGEWKMIVKADKVELYDLSKDIGERTNLTDRYPDRTQAMREAIDAWKQDVEIEPVSNVLDE